MRLLLTGFLALFFLVSASRLESYGQDKEADGKPLPTNRHEEPELGAISRGTELVGAKVIDQQQKEVGRITDLLIDLDAGRVVSLIVEVQGKAAPEWIALPATVAKAGVATIVAGVPPEAIASAPRIKLGPDSKPFTRAWAGENYQHFGQEIAWKGKEKDRLDHPLTLMSALEKTPVVDKEGQPLGQIVDAALLLDKGMIGYMAVAMKNGKPAQGKLLPIPLSAFVVKPGDKTWTLELEKDVLNKTPTIDANQWPEKIDRGWVEYVHVRYGRSPFAGVRSELHTENR